MVKRKIVKNKLVFTLGISLLLLGLLLAFIVNINYGVESTYFNDNDVGLIEIQIGENPLDVAQRLFFPQGPFRVGDSISPEERVQCTSETENQAITGITVSLIKPNTPLPVVIYDQEISNGVLCKDYPAFKTPFIPSVEGTWQGLSSHKTAESGRFIESPGQTIEVFPAQNNEPNCGEDRGWGDYSQYDIIANGQIDQREKYEWEIVNNQCQEKVIDTSYRTTCNSGYVIDGSPSDNAAVGKHSCIKISNDDDDTTTGCNAPTKTTCDDGTEIIRQQCVNGQLIDTGNQCSVNDSDDSDNDNVDNTDDDTNDETTNNETQQGTTITLNCYQLKPTTQVQIEDPCNSVTVQANTGETCEDKGNFPDKTSCESTIIKDTTEINYFLWGFLIISSLIGIGLIVLIIRRFKR